MGESKRDAKRRKEHGSHFVGARRTTINDEWQTCLESFKQILATVSKAALLKKKGMDVKQAKIWMPFYYDGKCAEHLKELGCENVYHESEDFFEKIKDTEFLASVDFIWDNPPYTGQDMKEKILSTLKSTGTPFVLLFPSSILHTQLLRELSMRDVQVIIPHRVHVTKKETTNSVPFKGMVWLVRGMDLPRDLNLL